MWGATGLFVALKKTFPLLFSTVSLSLLVSLLLSGWPNEAEGCRSARAHAWVHYAPCSLELGKTKQAILPLSLSLMHISAKCLLSRGCGGVEGGWTVWGPERREKHP